MPKDTEQTHLEAFVAERSDVAFERLVAQHITMVYGCALRRTGDPALAEDVSQQVFTILACKAPRLQAGGGLAGWLHQTTLYESRKALRGEARHQRKMKALAEHQTLERETAAAEVLPVVDEAIGELPKSDRRVVLLHYIEGQSFREISQAVGKSEAASQKQASRALEKLQKILRRRGVVVSAGVLGSVLMAESTRQAPAGAVASMTGEALAGAGSLSPIVLITNSLQTKSYTKTKAAILVALVAAVPVTMQWRSESQPLHQNEPLVTAQTQEPAGLAEASTAPPRQSVTAISASQVSADGESILLRQILPVGKKIHQSVTLDQKMVVKGGPGIPDNGAMNVTNQITMGMSMDISKRDKGKQAILEYSDLKMDVDASVFKQVFDSSEPGSPLASVVGKKITVLYDKEDQIESVAGADALLEGDGVDELGVRAMLEGFFSEGQIEHTIKQGLLQSLPTIPLKIGDRWPYTMEIPAPQGDVMVNVKGTYTLQELSEFEGHPCAKIGMKGVVASKEKITIEVGAAVEMAFLDSQLEGTILFDYQLGLPRKTHVSTKLRTSFDLPGLAEGVFTDMHMTMTQKITKIEPILQK